MKTVTSFLCIALLAVAWGTPAFSQIKTGKKIENVTSRYVVADSAVFVYFLGAQSFPYKVYDFSTQSVYVFFGNSEVPIVAHDFSALAAGEIEYMRDIGCDGAHLSSSFRRFCN